MALLAATLRSGPERLTLLFKECVCGLAGDEEYWRVLVFCFFKSSHFSLFLLPPSPRPGSAECCCVHLVGGGHSALRGVWAEVPLRPTGTSQRCVWASKPGACTCVWGRGLSVMLSHELNGVEGLHHPPIQNRPCAHLPSSPGALV